MTGGTVELSSVSRSYGRHSALECCSLVVQPAELLGIVGPNGAGKTTLLRIMAGLLRPTRGTVRRGFPPAERVAYFGGERTLPPRVSAAAWRYLCTGAHGSAPDRRLGVLSRGTRQRVGLESVLAGQIAPLILLDEPWEGLDPDAGRWLSGTLVSLRNQGAAVVVSSHRLHDLADVCTRCVFLAAGRVAQEAVRFTGGESSTDRSKRLFEAYDLVRHG